MENYQEIINKEARAKHVAACKLEAAFKLFEAASIVGDTVEAEKQRSIIHSLQDLILDSMQVVCDVIARNTHG